MSGVSGVLWVCYSCSTAYAAGLSRCPHCQGTSFHEQNRAEWIKEHNMPKITVHGGVTNASAPAGIEPATPEPEPAEIEGDASASDRATAPADASSETPAETTAAGEAPVAAVEETEEAETSPAEEGAPSVERPAQNDPKADWVAYAVALGMNRDDAERHTKKDLIATCDKLESDR